MSDIDSFKNTLEDEYDFPAEYSFKFIIKSDSISKVLDLLPGSDYSKRESKNRKYTSVTISKIMKNADEILYIYEKASKIDDIISL
ncbi:MAG: DUF493 domain-containing protein [Flammeovirgaceae bacterium]|nr:DUF493 domain-containing protein [Flammeovirgaceae bacterium]|tara:strand:+ start:332 stop:589 length:258 start_codon:yes stop_codon:yes gene_type:complete